MAILVANLGTSDLSVRPQGKDFYLPIRFDRKEPNLQPPDPDTPEADIWDKRDTFVCNLLCAELGVAVTQTYNGEPTFVFRELTEKLWQAYQSEPDFWHDRIRPGRIGGVIRTAHEKFGLSQAYLFVTDQAKSHDQDTVYLFKILESWLKREMPEVHLKAETIPAEIIPIDQDALLEHYGSFFSRISLKLNQQRPNTLSDEVDDAESKHTQATALISIKGGTPQMVTALRLQAIASAIRFQANLEPQLTVSNVLRGQPSPCKAGVYWQYAKGQRYQMAKLLLVKRWDFDGAVAILNDWQKFLSWLVDCNLAEDEVKMGSEHLQGVVAVLRIAQNAWNLAQWEAQQLAKNPEYAAATTSSRVAMLVNKDGYDRLLNLYTQCRIYWQLGQTANFFTRMASFYEEVQLLLLNKLADNLPISNVVEDWTIDANKLKAIDAGYTWRFFESNVRALTYNERFTNHPFEKKPKFEVMGRDNKSALLKAFMSLQPQSVQKAGEALLEDLGQLDFWATTRNKIIHEAKGPAPHRLEKHLAYHRNDRNDSGRQPHPLSPTACEPDNILRVMTRICTSELDLVRSAYRERYLDRHCCTSKGHYYIYGDARHWALQQLT